MQIMDAAGWEEFRLDTLEEMARYVFPFTTPISRPVEPERGYAWGTGNYLRDDDNVWLVTNEHVARPARHESLSHLPKLNDDYVRVESPFHCHPWPDDLAIARLSEATVPANEKILSTSHLDNEYQPVEHELLFWLGYPGSTATRHESITEANKRYSWFGSLETLAVPVVSQQLIDWPDGLPDDYKPDSHILVHYRAHGQRGRGVPDAEAPNPHGMSGSFLWDTKRVACWRSGKEWSPQYARVCGVVWTTFANPDMIVATPIQQLRGLMDVNSSVTGRPTAT